MKTRGKIRPKQDPSPAEQTYWAHGGITWALMALEFPIHRALTFAAYVTLVQPRWVPAGFLGVAIPGSLLQLRLRFHGFLYSPVMG